MIGNPITLNKYNVSLECDKTIKYQPSIQNVKFNVTALARIAIVYLFL